MRVLLTFCDVGDFGTRLKISVKLVRPNFDECRCDGVMPPLWGLLAGSQLLLFCTQPIELWVLIEIRHPILGDLTQLFSAFGADCHGTFLARLRNPAHLLLPRRSPELALLLQALK